MLRLCVLAAFVAYASAFSVTTSASRRVGGGAPAARMHEVTLITPSGSGLPKFECPPDEHILDQAGAEGVDLPSSCHVGTCPTCCGKLVKGTVDQGEQSFLDDGQIKQGFVLTCITFPTSDYTIETHKEDGL
ncbi:chloroplast ferredixon [Pavlovales sp. CCMP2436]|nr:chloroplast ferredixon [Pavlovales sp. CCMP2436]